MQIGIGLNEAVLEASNERRTALLRRVEEAGLDHVTVGDHVSFHDGVGFDGLVTATALLASNSALSVQLGVYLLGLRHPLLSARALSTVAQLAPGRLFLGVGVGGEDRAEIENSGVDPRTRGRRLDETLEVLHPLLTGEPVTHDGEFFRLRDARILPAPSPAVPLLIGGSGDHAIERVVRFGDGWLGIFCSPRRFARTLGAIAEGAQRSGRAVPPIAGLTAWVGVGRSESVARELLGAKLASLYRLPAERFQHVTTAGTPRQVAEWLSAYRDAGANRISVVPVASSPEEAIDATAEVAELLADPAVSRS